MTLLIFLVLFPIRWIVCSFITVFGLISFGINWLLTGDAEHEHGISGFLFNKIPEALIVFYTVYIVHPYLDSKPVAWTFSGAIKVYVDLLRGWRLKASNDLSVIGRVKEYKLYARTLKNRRLWEAIERVIEKDPTCK